MEILDFSNPLIVDSGILCTSTPAQIELPFKFRGSELVFYCICGLERKKKKKMPRMKICSVVLYYFAIIIIILSGNVGFSGNSAGKESACKAGDPSLIPGARKILWRRDRLPIPVFLGFPSIYSVCRFFKQFSLMISSFYIFFILCKNSHIY